MLYNTYIYRYECHQFGSAVRSDKMTGFFKMHRNWSTEIEGLRDDIPAVADAPLGVRVTTSSAANEDKAASTTTQMPILWQL